MKIYNTMSRSLEEVIAIHGNQLGVYACGPTVYDYTHLGHLRKYVMDDVLVRTLRQQGFEVKFVQNITDVGHLASDGDTGEDKLEKGAKKYGKSVWEVAKEFEQYYWYSMQQIGNQKPDVSCRATDHIEQQLELVKQLEHNGYTYQIPGDGVYFNTAKFTDYGKLARLDLKQQQAGARVEASGKKNPSDFALWKFERAGENRAMSWPSPWSDRSFPGWHIECSAMAMHYLGAQFDIHTGGIDHIPVHHTNEIAQAEAATGHSPFVRYWVHHNFLLVEGEKMSKSLGNFFTIDDVLTRGLSPQALRLLFLTTHYRSEMNFTWDSLEGMQKSWEKLGQEVIALRELLVDSENQQLSDHAHQLRAELLTYLADDLNTPLVVASMWKLLKDQQLTASDKYQLLMEIDGMLGLGFSSAILTPQSVDQPIAIDQLPDQIRKMLTRRAAARQARDFASSDQLRTQLLAAGYKLEDQPSGEQVVTLARADD